MKDDSEKLQTPPNPWWVQHAWRVWTLIALAVWAILLTSHGNMTEVSEQWPIAVAMLLGSYFAGSTPLGGGIVGFPFLVLVFDMDASVGRDFSFAIQSVGMTSASIWILSARRDVAWRWLRPAMVGALLATPLGCIFFAPILSDLGSKLTFAILVGAYGLMQVFTPARPMDAPTEPDSRRSNPWPVGVLIGVSGGLLSVSCGSGSDIVIYMALMLFLRAELRCALYTSVILMAWTSLLGIATQIGLGNVTAQVQNAWLAAAPVVLFGAPLGAFVAARISRTITQRIVTLLCLGQVIWFCVHESLGLYAQLGVWLAVFTGYGLLRAAQTIQLRRLENSQA